MSTNFTDNDFNNFRRFDFETRADCMELYLIGKNNCTYNMQEIGELVFKNKNYGRSVSVITRYYNLNGVNSGIYKNGCSFEKKYGYRVSRQDIEALLRTYPDGLYNTDITFEQFLISRVNNAKKINQPQAYKQQTTTNQKPVQQNKQQQSMYDSMQRDVTPQYSNPAPAAAPSQLTIGELCRFSPNELTPQQLATLKAAGYEYIELFRSWRSPEQIAEDKAASEYYARKEAEEKAKREHDAKMAAAGYVKVGNVFDGFKWISKEEAWLQAATTLAMEKGRLAEYVMNQVNTGELEFEVALLGHRTLGTKPEHTVSFQEIMTKKNKYLTFLPDKQIPVLRTCSSFNLLQTAAYGDDLTDVNNVYLIPRGYRIAKVLMCCNLQRMDLPDAIIVTLTCEDLRNVNNAGAQCPQCGAANMPGSIFCSKCGRMLG
jgi:hypothetical protein